MGKIITVLSLLLSLLGIFGAFFLFFFALEDISGIGGYILFNFQPYFFKGMGVELVTERISDSSYTSTTLFLVNLFFYLTFLSGTIIYFISKYKETRLLAFNYGLTLLYALLSLVYLTIVPVKEEKASTLFLILHVSIIVCYGLMSYFLITKYLAKSELNTYAENVNDTEKVYLEDASNYKRFLHLVIDTFLIGCIAYWFIDSANYLPGFADLFRKLEAAFGEQLGTLVYFYSIKIVYYLAFESLFKATPAKLLTRCTVTFENGENPDGMIILKRTLCRFIPLESISFLMGRNLHDSYSYTYVINQKRDNGKIDKLYFQVLGSVFFIFLVIYFYKIF